MLNRFTAFCEMIKFEHTVFALPFAYMGLFAARQQFPGWGVFALVTGAMVAARTAAMTLNRLIDAKIDAANPRTQNRPNLTGRVPLGLSAAVCAASLAVFFGCAYLLNPLCFQLSFAALIFLTGYHYVKRFSHFCHFVLGGVLSMAPMGGWLAVTGQWTWEPVWLALAVMFWVAGFDMIYSLQDMEFDRTHGLYSFPVWLGGTRAHQVSKLCHVLTGIFLGAFGLALGFGWVYWAGLSIAGALLVLEHRLIHADDLTHINTAFFTINGWIGVLMLVFTLLEMA